MVVPNTRLRRLPYPAERYELLRSTHWLHCGRNTAIRPRNGSFLVILHVVVTWFMTFNGAFEVMYAVQLGIRLWISGNKINFSGICASVDRSISGKKHAYTPFLSPCISPFLSVTVCEFISDSICIIIVFAFKHIRIPQCVVWCDMYDIIFMYHSDVV